MMSAERQRSRYHELRAQGLCVVWGCGEPTGGPAQCPMHLLRNAESQRASRRRRGIEPSNQRCSLCGERGHFRPTCPAEPTR